jgi:hypothetical protein
MITRITSAPQQRTIHVEIVKSEPQQRTVRVEIIKHPEPEPRKVMVPVS